MKPTFLDFLLFEDLAGDVLVLQGRIASLQSRKANIDRPIDNQIISLTKALQLKQQQLSQQKQATPTATPAQQQQPATTRPQ
jgi:hypothetical protein